MAEISLNLGLVALVDDSDLELANQYRWTTNKNHYVTSAKGRIYLHRLLLGAVRGQIVDHIDRDPLNNQRANLRFATKAQNAWNMGPKCSNKFGLRGVRTHKPGIFRACLRVNGKTIHIGCYGTPEEAGRAYDAVAAVHYGEFARLNFPALTSPISSVEPTFNQGVTA